MDRRRFLHSAGAAAAGLAFPGRARAAQEPPAPWRRFEVTTRVEILRPEGETRAWLPLPLVVETPYQRALGDSFEAGDARTSIANDEASATRILCAAWPEGARPVLTLTSRVATRDHAVDLAGPPSTSGRAARAFLRPTALIPTDGIVKARATEIVRGAAGDLDKARAIYEWIVDNTFRDPKVKGCGTGDIRFMLESGSLGGKCADLNALYVGLARAAGLPARDVYGIRLAPSRHGLKSLGAATANVTKSQHCRAEVHVSGRGWVPVDPADVRKVVLEEPPGNRPLDDAVVRATRARLFGSWEMNWMGYNFAHDVDLPGSKGKPIPFFMYPQAETAGGRRDSLDPDAFRYEISAREI